MMMVNRTTPKANRTTTTAMFFLEGVEHSQTIQNEISQATNKAQIIPIWFSIVFIVPLSFLSIRLPPAPQVYFTFFINTSILFNKKDSSAKYKLIFI